MTVWVVQAADLPISAKLYAAHSQNGSHPWWTDDVERAAQFATHRDATEFAAQLVGSEWAIVSHEVA